MRKEIFNEENKKARRKFQRISVRVFYGMILGIGFIGLLIPLRPKTSESEKRDLTKFPTPTVETVMSGEFFSDISTWYADTFPFREALSTANSKFRQLYGRTTEELHGGPVEADAIPDADAEITATPTPEPEAEPTATPAAEGDGTVHAEPEKAGTIYIADNRGFELYGFSIDRANDYINMINNAASQLKDKATVYDILVPTSIAVNLDEEMQEAVGSSNQGDAFDYIYGHLDSSIVQVPVLDVLRQHNGEYLYFKTDHHWTADGAYYAYQELMNKKGVTPSPLTDYTKNEYPGFVGTFYSFSEKSDTLLNNPDTVVTYTPKATNDMTYTDVNGQTNSWYIVMDPTDYSQGSKYSCFIGGDQPYCVIDNPEINDNSSCVVIKESYGNAFVPFLVNSYDKVHVIDYRYYTGNLIDFVEQNNIQDVIYLNNANAIIQSAVQNMNRLLQ